MSYGIPVDQVYSTPASIADSHSIASPIKQNFQPIQHTLQLVRAALFVV